MKQAHSTPRRVVPFLVIYISLSVWSSLEGVDASSSGGKLPLPGKEQSDEEKVSVCVNMCESESVSE